MKLNIVSQACQLRLDVLASQQSTWLSVTLSSLSFCLCSCLSLYLSIRFLKKGCSDRGEGPSGHALVSPQTLSPEQGSEVVGKDWRPAPISHSQTSGHCVPTNHPPTTPTPLHTSQHPFDCFCPQVTMVTSTTSADAISQNEHTRSPTLTTAFLPRALLNGLTPSPPLVSCRALQLPAACLL